MGEDRVPNMGEDGVARMSEHGVPAVDNEQRCLRILSSNACKKVRSPAV